MSDAYGVTYDLDLKNVCHICVDKVLMQKQIDSNPAVGTDYMVLYMRSRANLKVVVLITKKKKEKSIGIDILVFA